VAKRKTPKRKKPDGAPVPSVEEKFAKMWQLTVEAYGAAALRPMRRDIARIIRRKRRKTP
jgi:hypothetical protein